MEVGTGKSGARHPTPSFRARAPSRSGPAFRGVGMTGSVRN